jgi:topoisomerase-4 subunit A
LGDNGIDDGTELLLLTDTVYPRIKVTFGGNDSFREAQEIDCEQFIGVKGFKAKGKRISTFDIDGVEELEPTRFPEVKEEPEDAEEEQQEEENLDPDAGKSQQQVIDELSGQLRIFDNE